MSQMELPRPLFDWLQRYRVVDRTGVAGSVASRNTLVLDKATTRMFESGEALARLLLALLHNLPAELHIDQHRIEQEVHALQAVKPTVSKVRKLHNWNVLAPSLKLLSIELADDARSEIAGGDYAPILLIVDHLHHLAKSHRFFHSLERGLRRVPSSAQSLIVESSSKKQRLLSRGPAAQRRPAARGNGLPPRPQAQRDTQSDGAPASYTSGVDMLCMTLAGALGTSHYDKIVGFIKVPPKRILLFRKGIHGKFDGIVKWLQQMVVKAPQLAEMLVQDSESIPFVLSVVATGLRSTSTEVVIVTARALCAVAYALHGVDCSDALWDWFAADEGLEAFLTCYRAHKTILPNALFPILVQFGQHHFGALFETTLPALFVDTAEHLVFLHDFVAVIADKPGAKQLTVSQGCVQHMVRVALAAASPAQPDADRLVAVPLLTALWTAFRDEIEADVLLPKTCLKVLKKACREGSRSLQVTAFACLFELLDFYACRYETTSFCPLIFKHIVFSLIENYADDMVRFFFIMNLDQIMSKTESLNLGVLVGPFLKQLMIHGYGNVDLDFMLTLAKYTKLETAQATVLVRVLSQICVRDELYGPLASVPVVVILQRFRDDEAVIACVVDLATQYLDRFINSRFEPPAVDHAASPTKMDDDLLRRTLLLEWLAKVCNLRIAPVNAEIRAQVHVLLQTAEDGSREAAGLNSLAQFFR